MAAHGCLCSSKEVSSESKQQKRLGSNCTKKRATAIQNVASLVLPVTSTILPGARTVHAAVHHMHALSAAMDCVVCGKNAEHQCAGCKRVKYCSQEHQKKDWPTHKGVCKQIKATLTGGWSKLVLKEGSGGPVGKGCTVSVHYTGTLLNGSVFDSSRDKDSPLEFKLGEGAVIRGWDEGVASMELCDGLLWASVLFFNALNKVGERIRLVLSPTYAYGASGSPPAIPPNSTLIFDVELLKVIGV